MAKSQLFRPADLTDYMVRFFTKLKLSRADAETVAEVLLAADLRGVDSHGIIRLNSYYGDRLRKGLIDPLSPVTVLNETPVSLALSGGNGMGQVVGKQAMLRCIEKAKQSGIAMVTVRNSNHYGIAGYYAMMALQHDLIGISFTNSQPLVAPTYGRKALIGTNPIAVAVPAGKERPYVLDMATSIVPIGRITVYEKAGKPIPEGWGIDNEGRVTTNPTSVLKGGALMPLGGIDIMRGYKGYGLGLLVDIFSGVLSGSATGADVGHPSSEGRFANVGHFFAAIRPDIFRPLDEFKSDMDYLINQLKNSPKAVGKDRIFIHGEKEFELAEHNARVGIPLLVPVVNSLKEAGLQVGVEFNLPVQGEVDEEE
ncbi:MAG TPA: Ldh family oxidoreductase [Anaerolineaceae bacterium]|nr:Ldh family oxidoreductase [Anaerolineaceae bacterium]